MRRVTTSKSTGRCARWAPAAKPAPTGAAGTIERRSARLEPGQPDADPLAGLHPSGDRQLAGGLERGGCGPGSGRAGELDAPDAAGAEAGVGVAGGLVAGDEEPGAREAAVAAGDQ